MAKQLKSVLLKDARLSLSNPTGYCGHHCDFCSYKMCGGCRSEYVGNSYKKACGGTCPNIACAQEKGLEGCYLCDDLLNCNKGFYSISKKYAAKAKAVFIKKHGEECYTVTLKRAIDSSKQFAKSFDNSDSVENALMMLESYV